MELSTYFKSIIDQDTAAVVICNLKHEILYMNPASIAQYQKYGGANLLGDNLLQCHNARSCKRIKEVLTWFAESPEHNRMFTFHNAKQNKDVYMIALRDADGTLIGYYEKHEYRNPETSKMYHFV